MSRLSYPSRPPSSKEDWESFLRWIDGWSPAAGTWTPVLTFATPGDLAVTYSGQYGYWYRVGDLVTVQCNIVTSAFTHTTAAGEMQVTGLPWAGMTVAGISFDMTGAVRMRGWTNAAYTYLTSAIRGGDAYIHFVGNASGIVGADMDATDMPTGGNVAIRTTITYHANRG